MPERDPRFEETIVRLMQYCKERKLQAHTTRGQTLVLKPRRPKKSRLTGEPR